MDMVNKKALATLSILIGLILILAGCGAAAGGKPVPIKGRIILATTTSTEDSGLLGYIMPDFTAKTGWEADVVAVGSGAAMQMGREGQADVLLVHSRADEDKFIADGCGARRYDVMYNDYVVVGPGGGPISLNNNIGDTFGTIAATDLTFISRGDESGTHKKELAIWKSIDINPEGGDGYVSAGQGMGAVISMASEMDAYTLSDRATWLNYPDKGNLVIVCEGHPDLFNPYGVIPVSKSVSDKINTKGGQAFADWIISKPTQELIGQYGVEEFGQPLFIPSADAK
jgi:tungstate transport system substrate-binding protein